MVMDLNTREVAARQHVWRASPRDYHQGAIDQVDPTVINYVGHNSGVRHGHYPD